MRAKAIPKEMRAVRAAIAGTLGVVFRDLTARESLSPPWRDLLVGCAAWRLEGSARRRFVSGYVGEQFATLRQWICCARFDAPRRGG